MPFQAKKVRAVQHYLFKLSPGFSISKSKKLLKNAGLKEIYSLEDKEEKSTFLGGFSDLEITLDQEVATLISKEEASIDWNEQSALFSPFYKDGHIEIDLCSYGKNITLRLLPGEGFGDLSHPTTQLMLEALPPYIGGKRVLDIGCGSGVLTLASQMLGSFSSVGVDIDPKAIEHAYNNLNLNRLSGITFFHP